MKTPNYKISEDFSFVCNDLWDKKIIPAGTFVRPIELQYVPQHIKDWFFHKFFDEEKEIYVYCSYGMIAIPRKLLREV
jgi:hypothetical protein